MSELADEIFDACGFPGERRYDDPDQMLTLGYLGGKLMSTPTDVAIISDRAPLNLESLTGYASHSRLSVRGVILPGAELDNDMRRLVIDDWVLRAMLDGDTSQLEPTHGLDGEGEVVDRGDFVIRTPEHPFSDEREELFRLAHESYDAAKLRQPGGEGDEYRRGFGERLIGHLERMDPSVIFLDNFKVILPEDVVKAYSGRLINVHPSVLPLIKGYRPEKRAFEGENPEANGYTMHVVSEELDGGATLLQQAVPTLPEDEARRSAMGEEAYAEWREEQARLRIMVAQSPFVPWVLHLYDSGLDRIVVEGDEAFAAEGRPGFEKSEAYQGALAGEPDMTYRRVLFENPWATTNSEAPKYLTLEELLSAPPVAHIPPQISGIHRYRFNVPVLTDDPEAATFTDVEYMVQELNELGFGASMETGQILEHRAEVCLRTLTECAGLLQKMGIVFEGDQQRVHVRTPRQTVSNNRLHLVQGEGFEPPKA